MGLSFEEYKERVSIVQVAEALGYELNKKAGRNPLEYKHPDQNTIVISNPKGRQRYFTRHESENKGSVIDFVKHRLNMFNEYYHKEAEGINKVLASFAGEQSASPKKVQRTPVKADKKSFDKSEFTMVHPSIKDLIYLSDQRGLSENTLQTFLPFIRLVKANYYPAALVNIGFPYQIPDHRIRAKKEDWAGFELVNYLFKGHARGSDRANALWIADVSGLGTSARSAYVAESGIDAMSFYQLYRHKFPLDESAFLSTGGYVTDQQIRNLLQAYPKTMIHTVFDNDLNGHLYDIRTACMKENKNLGIHKEGNQLKFILDKQSIVLPENLVSLTNFKKESGLRPNIRVHKPKEKDFNEMLLQQAKNDIKNSIKIR
jgi:hypothetical protein